MVAFTLQHTVVGVSLCASTLLVLFRISEQGTSYVAKRSERMVEEMIELAERYHDESKRTTEGLDDLERMKLKAMALSLLQYAQIALSDDVLETIAGYSVGRRVRHLQQEMNKLRGRATATGVDAVART